MIYNRNIRKRMFDDIENNKISNYASKIPCVFCANCGGLGHIYKNCNFPITSYGIICFKLIMDRKNHSVYPIYLMVQRKDSLNKVEFIRGKYELKQKDYILNMFENMTEEERIEIRNHDFETIWKNLWKIDNCNQFEKEFKDSKAKFDILKKGYIIDRGETKGGHMHFSIDYILENTKSNILESEWGFPKGRRNINESDIDCAIRELNEETSMKMNFLKCTTGTHLRKPFQEVIM